MRCNERGVALLAALFILLVPSVALACPICFQVEDANTIAGVRAGVIVLMSVTVVVLSAVAAFSIRIWRNEKVNRPDA
jgi:type II secretory pathway component PulK